MTNKDHSYIHNMEDLEAMKVMLKIRIKDRERDLAERLHNLPQETIKATIGGVVPFFLRNKVAGTTWQLVRGSLGLIFGKNAGSKTGIKESLLSSAKKLGLFTLLKTAIGLWKKK